MNIADIIKQARENLGLTQEELAERLDVSRQAVSKWELGASVPSSENLKLLEEVLGITFPAPEEPAPPAAPKAAFWTWKRVVLLMFGALILMALLSAGTLMALKAETRSDVPRHKDPYITDIVFFDEDAAPLQPDLGDGWCCFEPNRKVFMAVSFQAGWDADGGAEADVDAVSLFLTPSGTETFDLRQQVGVQGVADGRHLALFAVHIPEGLSGHLDIVLESGGVQAVARTLNILADPDSAPPPVEDGMIALSATDITLRMGDPHDFVLSVWGASARDVAWISADPDIAAVSTTGMVRGVSPGVTTVTAEWNGQTAECVVRVAGDEE